MKNEDRRFIAAWAIKPACTVLEPTGLSDQILVGIWHALARVGFLVLVITNKEVSEVYQDVYLQVDAGAMNLIHEFEWF
jgi:hypothetical protein